MRRFKFSIGFGIIIIIYAFFMNQLHNMFKSPNSFQFFNYVVFGFVIPFFIVLIIKSFISKNTDTFILILSLFSIIIYFLLIRSNSPIGLKLLLFLFLILGILSAFEKKSSMSILPILILALCAVLSQIAIHRSFSIGFYQYDVYLRILFGFTGYLSISFGFKN